MNSSNSNYKITITGNRKYLQKTRELIHYFFIQNGLDDMEASVVEMAVTEACHNALRHGGEKREQASFDLILTVDEKAIKAIIINRGDLIDFDNIEPFHKDQDFLSYKKGGLGIPLIKALMDDVFYKRNPDDTNELTLIKYLK